jgi:hypothetical protein
VAGKSGKQLKYRCALASKGFCRLLALEGPKRHCMGRLPAAAVALWRGTKLGFRRAFTLCTILFFGLQNRRGLAFFGVTAPLIVAYSPRFSGSVSIPGRSQKYDLMPPFNVHSTTE